MHHNKIHLNNKYRTHTCDELRAHNIGENVKLSGWVHRKRNHGGVLFIDIRDHYGITQLVFNENDETKNYKLNKLSNISHESVITISGSVVARANGAANKKLATGDVEVLISEYHVESTAEPLPLIINDEQDFPEETCLKYRFLDLRKKKLHSNIILRSKLLAYLRSKLINLGFNEISTPILTASSPEGARDFLVPSRIFHGECYALPQAPQQFKQLLMVAGFDKYFQIAPCFRDEDSRADRSFEFYQCDIEMSFVTQEDIFRVIEDVIGGAFETLSNKRVTSAPFPRITYRDAMLKYGSDKPDLRNPLIIHDVTDIFASSSFRVFANNIKNNGDIVRMISVPHSTSCSRSFFDDMILFAQKDLGLTGLAYVCFTYDANNNLIAKGPIAKWLTDDEKSRIYNIIQCDNKNNNDKNINIDNDSNNICDHVAFFVCGDNDIAAKSSGKIRDKVADIMGLIDHNVFSLCWIIDFPMFEMDKDKQRISFSHNPFSMPQGGLETLLDAKHSQKKQLEIIAYQYDLVCNGIELSSGAIRNHRQDIMREAFAIAGFTNDELEEQFGAMLRAFQYGAPPHGGIAPGIDRIIMLLADEPNIRRVIPFPLAQTGRDLMMDAPSQYTDQQLSELGMIIRKK